MKSAGYTGRGSRASPRRKSRREPPLRYDSERGRMFLRGQAHLADSADDREDDRYDGDDERRDGDLVCFAGIVACPARKQELLGLESFIAPLEPIFDEGATRTPIDSARQIGSHLRSAKVV